MNYIEGFCGAVPLAKKEEFRQYCALFAPIFKEHGALGVTECWGTNVPDGEITSFPKAVQAKDDETVFFSWIVWPSKEVRDEAIKKLENHADFDPAVNPMPFDGKRMIMGGFEVILEA